jgi:type IV pilus assembly protein PilQ
MNHASKKLWHDSWLLLTLALIIGLMGGCASKAPTKPGVLEPEAAAEEKVIHEITLAEEATQSLVVIKGNQPLPYTSVKHLLPLGVVLYFPKTSLEGVQETYTPESPLIKSIVTTELTGRGGYSRVQINLKDDVPYKATQEKNRLLVCFKKAIAEGTGGEERAAVAPKEPAVPEPEKGIEVERGPEPRAQGVEPVGPTPASAEAGQVGKPAFVNRIDFIMLDGGKSRVTIGTTNRVRYETEKPSDKRLLLKLLNTKIPKSQKRPLIATRFKSAVDLVVPIQTAKMRDTAVISIELREAVPYRVEQKENVLVVDLEPSTVPPRPLPDVKAPKWQQVMKEAEAEIAKEAEAPPEEPVFTETGKAYTGQKISLDFQDADIRHVFRILHEISGKNFVIGEDVKGRVTLRLDNVPWDQVLDLILSMNKLDSVEEGNVVRIAKLSTLEAENKAARAKAKAEQAAKELEPAVTAYIPVNYAEASSVKTHLEEIKTDRGKVTIDERTNMIIMKDIQTIIDDAKQVVKRLDVVTPQVMIEARIVEANTDFSRELGIQWGGKYGIHPGDATYGIGPQRGYDVLDGTYGFSGGVGDNWVVNLPAAGPTSGIGFNFARLTGYNPLTLQANLLAMEAEGKGKIISSPRVLTLDNKKAYIEQGVEIPYQVLEEGSYSLKWASAVLKLEVTPHITMDRRIAMNIVAKKDAPDWSRTVQGAPAINKKETGTELLVNDGDTVVIGGIIVREESFSTHRVPWLSSIPVLGWLFKSESRIEEKRELLIFVMPTIVKLEGARLMEQAVVSEANQP